MITSFCLVFFYNIWKTSSYLRSLYFQFSFSPQHPRSMRPFVIWPLLAPFFVLTFLSWRVFGNLLYGTQSLPTFWHLLHITFEVLSLPYSTSVPKSLPRPESTPHLVHCHSTAAFACISKILYQGQYLRLSYKVFSVIRAWFIYKTISKPSFLQRTVSCNLVIFRYISSRYVTSLKTCQINSPG